MAELIDNDDYQALLELYAHVKKLIATAEKADREQRISISAIAELRSALDHIMRAHSVSHGLVPENTIRQSTGMDAPAYCRKNIDKAIGHLYRAGYDAYDCISIKLIEEIEDMLSGVSQTTLYQVVPDAATKIVRPYDKCKVMFVSAKTQKDVESREQERKAFDIYEEAASQLTDIRELLVDSLKSITDYEKEIRGKSKVGLVVNVAIGVGCAFIGWLLGSL